MEDTFYMPLTAAPFRKNEAYKEVLPKNAELAKYIVIVMGSVLAAINAAVRFFICRREQYARSMTVP